MKKILKRSLTSAILWAAFIWGAVVYASATIPGACSTPWTCTDITSTFQAIVSKTNIKFLDSDASNSVTIKANDTTTEDVVITLPATNWQANQILTTNDNGKLVWEDKPHNIIWMIGFMIPDNLHGIYEINWQTVTDAKLATYITANPINGFSVSGNNVTLPDWRGRYLGAMGGLWIWTNTGFTMDSSNKSHSHTIKIGKHSWDNSHNGTTISSGNYSWGSASYYTNLQGSTYARPETATMPIVIIGWSL